MRFPDKNKNEFLDALRNELCLKGISQRDIAKWLKINPSQVSRLLDGTHTFPIEYLSEILKRARISSNLYVELLKILKRG